MGMDKEERIAAKPHPRGPKTTEEMEKKEWVEMESNETKTQEIAGKRTCSGGITELSTT